VRTHLQLLMAPEMQHVEVVLITGPRRQRFLSTAGLQLHHVFVAFFLIYPAYLRSVVVLLRSTKQDDNETWVENKSMSQEMAASR